MEGGAKAELDIGQAEELRPQFVGEDWIPVAHNRSWDVVKAHHMIEEGSSDGHGSVGVAEHDEVCILG